MSSENSRTIKIRDFWGWFWREAGWRSVAGSWRWNVAYVALGALVAVASQGQLSVVASSALLPFVSATIGAAFALSASAISLAQTSELNKAVDHLDEDVLTFQASFLTVLAAAVLCGLAALGVFDSLVRVIVPTLGPKATKRVLLCVFGRTLFFAMLACAIRECWGMVSMTTTMVTSFVHIQRAGRGDRTPEGQRVRLTPQVVSTAEISERDPGGAAEAQEVERRPSDDAARDAQSR